MRIVDIQLGFPAILVALVLLAVLGKGVDKIIIALVTVQWAYYARTARSAALVERNKEYIEAARSLGLSGARIVLRHLLPNALPPLIVVGTVQVAHAIALEATLSFLGLGLPPTEPSLGLLIANGYEVLMSGKYWISMYPGHRAAANDPRDQPGRRSVARHFESAAGKMTRTALRAQPAHRIRDPRRRAAGGRRRFVRPSARRGARPGRRIGLRKIGHRIFDSRSDRSAGTRCAGSIVFDGTELIGASTGTDARSARQAHRDDLPGSDDDAESGAVDRNADGRNGARA